MVVGIICSLFSRNLVYLIGVLSKKIRSPSRMWYCWDALRKGTNFLAVSFPSVGYISIKCGVTRCGKSTAKLKCHLNPEGERHGAVASQRAGKGPGTPSPQWAPVLGSSEGSRGLSCVTRGERTPTLA